MQRQRRNHFKITFIGLTVMLSLIVAGGIAGCSDSGKPSVVVQTPASVKPKQQVITQGTATIMEQKPQAVYSYNPVGKRDPFMPIIVKDDRKTPSGDRPPLERFNISEFKLTGVVWGGFGYSAMLEGPEGKGYFVHVGTVIGQNKGVVKKIMKDAMIVEEKFKTISGETDRKEIVIELRKKQEGMQ
jgi:type IV pilus assembly protein PilP